MSIIANITEGWTGELGPFVMRSNNSVFDLTGMTVATQLRDSFGRTFVPTGTTRIGLAGNGEVFFKPVEADFKANGNVSLAYRIHFLVIDSAGTKLWFPNGQPDEIVVWPK